MKDKDATIENWDGKCVNGRSIFFGIHITQGTNTANKAVVSRGVSLIKHCFIQNVYLHPHADEEIGNLWVS